MSPERSIAPIEAGRANPKVVFDLLEDLRKAWEKILNDYAEGRTSAGDLPTERGGVNYIDAWMAGHNFLKLVIDNLAVDARLRGEAAALFYLSVGFTFNEAMKKRAQQAREQDAALHMGDPTP